MNATLEDALSVLTPSELEYKAKDFKSDQDVRWCPGCGDYAILAQMQKVLPELGIHKENAVFVSGIGCSSRFPYYMDAFGFHTIHGRAPAIATGLKLARPDLSVFVVTGDGDGLSIGGNHLIHALRRNIDLNIMLFNNEIYGLTKGQFSPTSQPGLVTKSTPQGSIDSPFNPLELALGARGAFVARAMDRDLQHLRTMLTRSFEHKGASFLEIYQNCPVFNDETFGVYTDKATKADNTLFVEHGKPMVFGADRELGIKLDGFTPYVVNLNEGHSADDCVVHNETDRNLARIVADMGTNNDGLPRPFGVIHASPRDTYNDIVVEQIKQERAAKGEGDLQELLKGTAHWVVK